MVKILSILYISILIPQNFIYDSEDWYIVKDPGAIYSITEGPFKVYFGTENGIFSYDVLEDVIQYDFQLNRGLTHSEQIFSIHYDNYSDQIWIVTNNGIFYKNVIFDTFNKVNLKNYDIYQSYNFGRLGSIDKYLIIENGSEYVFIDSFSGSQVSSPSEFNIDNVIWSTSFYNYNMNDIDLSKYYSDNWLIGFRTITDSYGNEESVNVYFEDSHFNLWFGTNNGKLIRGYKYSNKVDIYSIGPFSEGITSLARTGEGEWFMSSGRFKRYGGNEYFRYNKQSNPFLSIWNEYDNIWALLNEDDFAELNNPDVNYTYLIEGNYLALGLMEGLLIVPLNNYKNYYFIDKNKGLSDSAVFKIEHHNDKVFAMTVEGISVYSLSLNLIIEKNILDNYSLEDSGILDMTVSGNKLYFSTKSGLYLYDIEDQNIIKITDSIFYQIEHKNNKIYGLNHYFSIIDASSYDETVFYYDTARNFEVTDRYIWFNLQDKVKLVDLESKEEWTYDHNDGFNDIEIFDILDDGDWVCFLTSNGLMFYNWSSYHY
tara:strand:+ start:29 stop:1648 length:1620 start_codon:yes stop_codon:yes gene_type:complete